MQFSSLIVRRMGELQLGSRCARRCLSFRPFALFASASRATSRERARRVDGVTRHAVEVAYHSESERSMTPRATPSTRCATRASDLPRTPSPQHSKHAGSASCARSASASVHDSQIKPSPGYQLEPNIWKNCTVGVWPNSQMLV